MTAQEVWDKVKPVYDAYSIQDWVLKEVDQVGYQSVRDLRDKDNWGYYHFLGAFCKAFQPKQIVELGGAWGTATLVMSSELPKDSIVYSITLDERHIINGKEFQTAFAYLRDKDYPNIQPVIGDDLDLKSWPPDTDLSKTDAWFFDSLHTTEQLTKELELYKPFFHESTILFFDDIHMKELYPVWLDLPYDKLDVSQLHVPTGWGMAVC